MNRKLVLSAAGLVLLLVLLGASAFAITVTVNDQPLPATPPAIERNGRVLLPMREVFESLGATVQWQAATQTITAQREDKTVQMTIGRQIASIDGQPVTLDVPPMLIGGYTYVPVRFPAEALGADVRWYAPQQLVSISLPEIAGPPLPPVPPEGPPAPPPVATGGQVTGVVSGVSADRIAVRVDSHLESYPITAGTIVLRGGRQVELSQVEVGDQVVVQYDPQGVATVVQANFTTIAGTIRSIRGRQLALDTYSQPLLLQPGATITSPSGQALRLRDLRPGQRVVVRVTPDTNEAYSVAVRPEGAPGPGLTVTHNATGVLAPGQAITARVTGPAGATGWFDLGAWQRNLPLQEVRPGQYEGRFVIPEGPAPARVPVVVHLRTPQGRELQATAVAPLRIAQAPSGEALRVISPVAGESVGDRVVVEGYAEPLSDVVVTIDWQDLAPGAEQATGQLATTTVVADENGYFRTGPIALNPPRDIPQEDLGYTLSVASRTAGGQLSPPLQVALNP